MTGWMGVSSECRKLTGKPFKIPEDILFPLFFHYFSLKAYFCRPKTDLTLFSIRYAAYAKALADKGCGSSVGRAKD